MTIDNLLEPLNFCIPFFYNINSSIYLDSYLYYNELLLGYAKYLKDYDTYLLQL